jgi:hypothetical protein
VSTHHARVRRLHVLADQRESHSLHRIETEVLNGVDMARVGKVTA